ncbi:MAG: hypothetical protein JWO72_3098, partial [Caulobacteraceae bacterium]|nr:hypothetical protein [Caulobacteraceae bacterium]
MQRSALWSTLALALCAFVRPATAASPPPAWTVDGANSKLEFTSSFGGDAFKGVFRKWDARIVFDPAALTTSSVVVNVDLGSASTADESRDEALLSSDWFNTAKFPRATFSATKFSSLGGGRYQAAGTLAIRGVSRPVV